MALSPYSNKEKRISGLGNALTSCLRKRLISLKSLVDRESELSTAMAISTGTKQSVGMEKNIFF